MGWTCAGVCAPSWSVDDSHHLSDRAAGENDRVLGSNWAQTITLPTFSTRELVARVKAVLRRFERPSRQR